MRDWGLVWIGDHSPGYPPPLFLSFLGVLETEKKKRLDPFRSISKPVLHPMQRDEIRSLPSTSHHTRSEEDLISTFWDLLGSSIRRVIRGREEGGFLGGVEGEGDHTVREKEEERREKEHRGVRKRDEITSSHHQTLWFASP